MIAGFWEQDEASYSPSSRYLPKEVKVLCSSPRFSSRSPTMLEVFVSSARENVYDIAVETGGLLKEHRCFS
jgi:hypothetical protein